MKRENKQSWATEGKKKTIKEYLLTDHVTVNGQ